MVAVDGVHRYVVSHLGRIGLSCDVDDVMQDIRVAVWDGVAKGRYRELPGVPFGAWVQGVCSKVCAAHIRRELHHQTMPLLADFTTTESTPEILAVLRAGVGLDSAEKCIDQAWAQAMLGLVRQSVREETWKLAISSLTGPRRYGPPSPQDRRRWHAVTVVRQTAKTVNTALNCVPESISDVDSLCRCAANCLPTLVLRKVAETIVRPGLRGLERATQIAVLAAELGVTERYIAVNIGFARQLYRAAWRVLQHAANRPGV
jgi:DNA-directed RNA polymerase specialized sigma24 family protein